MELYYKGTILRGGKSFLRNFSVYKEEAYLVWELTQGQSMLVDIEQFDYLVGVTWSVSKATNRTGFYVTGGGTSKLSSFKVHQYLAGLQRTGTSIEVDHKNGNSLDNRLCNLRLSTRKQQQLNTPTKTTKAIHNGTRVTSAFRGVRRNRCGNWQVTFQDKQGNTQAIGTYKDEGTAAKVWDKAIYTEFADDFPLQGVNYRGIVGEPTVNFIKFNFPEELV